ncbi:MAG: hypothetical protein JW839_01055 [Candidatus Lokiarchaeota archaeon]|nr:hypothetical protein [Candidatus Lokiarchaeota archaeon]
MDIEAPDPGKKNFALLGDNKCRAPNPRCDSMNSLIIYAINEEKLLAAPLKYYLRPHFVGHITEENVPNRYLFDEEAVDLVTSLLPKNITCENGIIKDLGSFDTICTLAQEDPTGIIEDMLKTYVDRDSPYIFASEEQDGSAGILTTELETFASPALVRWFSKVPHKPFKTIVARKDFEFLLAEATKILESLEGTIASSEDPSYTNSIFDDSELLLAFMQKMVKIAAVDYLLIDTF